LIAGEVASVHLRTDVEVAQLRQGQTLEVAGQAFDREPSPHHLEPMRLDLPGVPADGKAGTEGGRLREGTYKRKRAESEDPALRNQGGLKTALYIGAPTEPTRRRRPLAACPR